MWLSSPNQLPHPTLDFEVFTAEHGEEGEAGEFLEQQDEDDLEPGSAVAASADEEERGELGEDEDEDGYLDDHHQIGMDVDADEGRSTIIFGWFIFFVFFPKQLYRQWWISL